MLHNNNIIKDVSILDAYKKPYFLNKLKFYNLRHTCARLLSIRG